MSLFSNLVESILKEIKYDEWKTNQSSITRLFPSFYKRVKDVASAGGIAPKLSVQDPDTWMFSVKSSGGRGDYAVWFHFTNIPELLNKWVPIKDLWNKARTGIDYSKLAAEMLYDLDMQSDCDCAADTFWGSEYIKTQKRSQYGKDQTKAPDIRNPHKYGIMCKHAHLVWQQLPMWMGTFAKHLKDYWKDEIEDIVKRILDTEKSAAAKNQPKEQTPTPPEASTVPKEKGVPMTTKKEPPLKTGKKLPEPPKPEVKPEAPLNRNPKLPGEKPKGKK